MAMKPCKDCGESMSSLADECRHCGRTTNLGRLDHFASSGALLLLLFAYFAFK